MYLLGSLERKRTLGDDARSWRNISRIIGDERMMTPDRWLPDRRCISQRPKLRSHGACGAAGVCPWVAAVPHRSHRPGQRDTSVGQPSTGLSIGNITSQLRAKRGATIADATSLASAFRGAEAVFVLVPPNFDPAPGFPEARATAASLKAALERADPGRVVYLSTIGAQGGESNLLTQHTIIERVLGVLPMPITFLRPAWFMENFRWDVAAARESGIIMSFLGKPASKPKTDRANKKAEVIAMMKRAKGATLAEIMAVTEWQAHTVRGFVSILGSKGGEKIESSKNAAGERTYKIGK